MTQKGRIYNQREIFELQEVISQLEVPFNLEINSYDNSIHLGYKTNPSIQAILKKHNLGFRADYVSSSGTEGNIEEKEWKTFKYRLNKWINVIRRDNPFDILQKVNVNLVSPKFYLIFKEATIIKGLGFNESSGMIYRKALEVIVKDFLNSQFPEEYRNLLSEKTIGRFIFHFYDKKDGELVIREDEKFGEIKSELEELKYLAKVISNTFKIGNDFAHYERRLSEFTPEYMENNILQIIEYVDNRIELRNRQEKQKEMDINFRTNKLI